MPGIGEVGERLRRSTVQVTAGRSGGGSGVIWDAGGSIVTNAHVARGTGFRVRLWDDREYRARVVKRDLRRDIALLEISARDLAPAEVGDSGRLRVGEVLIAVGNPLGFTGALSTGVVHAVGPLRGLGSEEYVQATVRLAPGNSGGPLADSLGRVVGINTMVVSGGLGLAIPSNTVRHFLAAGPQVELGVTVQPVRIRNGEPGIGWVVMEVEAGSPAERASLQPGDVITGANGREFAHPEDLARALDGNSGATLVLQFQRGGQPRRREVAVRLVDGVAA